MCSTKLDLKEIKWINEKSCIVHTCIAKIMKSVFNGIYAELFTLQTFILEGIENNKLYPTKY